MVKLLLHPRNLVPLLLAGALTGCVSGGEAANPGRLTEDRAEPVLALFEHVLTGHFASGGVASPAACAVLEPAPLSGKQEKALLDRFVRLSPASTCEADDAVRVYQFSCAGEELCSGWVSRPGAPATRYVMRYEGGAWRFDGDMRIIAE